MSSHRALVVLRGPVPQRPLWPRPTTSRRPARAAPARRRHPAARSAPRCTLVGPDDTIQVADGSYLGFDVDEIDGLPGQPITIRATGHERGRHRHHRPARQPRHHLHHVLRLDRGGRAARVEREPRGRAHRPEPPRHGAQRRVRQQRHLGHLHRLLGRHAAREQRVLRQRRRARHLRLEQQRPADRARATTCTTTRGAGLHMNGDESAGGDGIISGGLVENNVIHGNGVGGGAGHQHGRRAGHDRAQQPALRQPRDRHRRLPERRRRGPARASRSSTTRSTRRRTAAGRCRSSTRRAPILVRNNVLYNRHPTRGSLNYGNATRRRQHRQRLQRAGQGQPGRRRDHLHARAVAGAWATSRTRWCRAPLASLFVNANGGDYHLPGRLAGRRPRASRCRASRSTSRATRARRARRPTRAPTSARSRAFD